MGQFRGTAFVRFATPEIAHICVDKLEKADPRIHGKRLKLELLRQVGRGRAYSAKDILEAGQEVDARFARVRDLIISFAESNRSEMNLPTDMDSDQRKLAHSLAEKFGLVHTTVSPNGDPLDASPRSGHSPEAPMRTVHISKKRPTHSRANSMNLADHNRSIASLVTAAVTNDLHKITPMLPEVPVFAVRSSNNLDQIAMMHAAQAQIHADAARAAIEASKRAKERDEMPDWLEIVDKPHQPLRARSKSILNAHAPEFIPSASLTISKEDLGAPPGLPAPTQTK